MWKRILLAYLAVALVAFVVWMVPVAEADRQGAFWPQTWKVTKQQRALAYLAFRHVVKFRRRRPREAVASQFCVASAAL